MTATPRWAVRCAHAATALLTAVVVALVGVAGPARADDPVPDLSVSFGVDEANINVTGTTIGTYLYNNGAAPATDVTVTFDGTGLSDNVLLSMPDSATACALASRVVTCDHGDLAANQVDTIHVITLASKVRAPAGPAGSVAVTIRGTGPDGGSYHRTEPLPVTIEPSGPDLVAMADDLNSPAHRAGPGDTLGVHAALRNEGDTTAEGFFIWLQIPHSTEFAEEYSDCTYEDYWPGDRHTPGFAYGPSAVRCTAPLPLAPGEAFLLFDPTTGESIFNAFVGKNMSGPAEHPGSFEVGLIDDLAASPARATARRGNGGSFAKRVASLAAKTTQGRRAAAAEELDSLDNYVDYRLWSRSNTIDFSVTATAVTGAVGDIVEVPYVLVNNGPSDGSATWQIVAPSGTVLLSSERCYFRDNEGRPIAQLKTVRCGIESEWPAVQSGGGRIAAKIKVKILASPGADGTITMNNDGPSTDTRTGNNVARLSITSGGVELPVTGTRIGVIASAGAGVLLLGWLLVAGARRRRVVLVPPTE